MWDDNGAVDDHESDAHQEENDDDDDGIKEAAVVLPRRAIRGKVTNPSTMQRPLPTSPNYHC